MKKLDVLGIGNPLVDIIIPTEDAVLEKLNIPKGSMNLVDVDRQKEIIAQNESLRIVRFLVKAEIVSRKAKPGQFVIAMLEENGERFPLTIVDSDPHAGLITLIVQEAGGKVTDFSGDNNYLFGKNIIASNGKFHSLLVDKISRFYGKFNGLE